MDDGHGAYRSDGDDDLIARVEDAVGQDTTLAKVAWRAACGDHGVQSPGALGWLLALVREAWEDSHIVVDWDGVVWSVQHGNGYLLGHGPRIAFEPAWGDTEAEALVRALEAAKW